MAATPPPLELDHGSNDYSLLASLPSTILTHLCLEHLIPAFNNAQIDIFRLLMMKDPGDFANVGIYNSDECRRLSQCVRSIHAHMSYKGLTIIASTPSDDSLPSPSSSSSIYSNSNNPTSLSTMTTTTTSEQEQKSILRAIEAFDRYALPSFYSTSSAWSRTSSSSSSSSTSPPTPPPFSKLENNSNYKGKVSVRSSFLSTFSESTMTTTVEEDDEEEFIRNYVYSNDNEQQQKILDHPPPYNHFSQQQLATVTVQHQHDENKINKNASSSPLSALITTNTKVLTPNPKQQQTASREGNPGVVVPRQPRNLISRVPRPLSMPAYLMKRSSIATTHTINTEDDRPVSPASTVVTQHSQQKQKQKQQTRTKQQPNRRSLIVLSSPPPDYRDTALMKRWEKCKSCINPREEEGREELPPYKCTVYKMGHVYIKRELDEPGVRSRWRSWRKLYVEIWGTILRIYRAPPHGEHGNRYRLLGRQPLLATRLPLSQWNRYYYSPLTTISLAGAEAGRAWDYTKRPHSLRLKTVNGPQLLLRLSSHVEMISWIEHLQAAINISLDLEQRPMPKFMTLPARATLTGAAMTPRALEIERAREQRRRSQREMLI